MTQPISGAAFPASRSARRQGRKTEGPGKALIRCRASRVEGQCGGEIGQLHGKKEAKRDHFLTLSLFPSLNPSGRPQYGLVISRSTDGC